MKNLLNLLVMAMVVVTGLIGCAGTERATNSGVVMVTNNREVVKVASDDGTTNVTLSGYWVKNQRDRYSRVKHQEKLYVDGDGFENTLRARHVLEADLYLRVSNPNNRVLGAKLIASYHAHGKANGGDAILESTEYSLGSSNGTLTISLPHKKAGHYIVSLSITGENGQEIILFSNIKYYIDLDRRY